MSDRVMDDMPLPQNLCAARSKALYRFLWDEAETQGMGGMKKGNEVSNL